MLTCYEKPSYESQVSDMVKIGALGLDRLKLDAEAQWLQ